MSPLHNLIEPLRPERCFAVWHWTGNKELVRQYIKPALDGLAWADRYLLDDSGFYRYRTRSKQGEHNQGWKAVAKLLINGRKT